MVLQRFHNGSKEFMRGSLEICQAHKRFATDSDRFTRNSQRIHERFLTDL